MSLSVLLVDDEPDILSSMSRILRQAGYHVDTATSIAEATDRENWSDYFAVLLDRKLPDGLSDDLIPKIKRLAPQAAIFVITAYADLESSLASLRNGVEDYLLKPIEPKRLEETVNKLIEKKRKKIIGELDKENLAETDQVFVKDGEKCWFVKLETIRLFESEGNYVRIYFGDNKPLILRTLNYLDERLDDKTFFRANRKHIINLKWIASIEPWLNGGLLVKLKDGQKVEVSRRQAIKFKDMLSL